jgi:hypothetical protein
MQVVCINDKKRPHIISEDEWITEGEVYTVINIQEMSLQSGKLGYKLKEITLTQKSAPYEYYDADRFEILFDVSLKNVLSEDLDDDMIEPADFDLI